MGKANNNEARALWTVNKQIQPSLDEEFVRYLLPVFRILLSSAYLSRRNSVSYAVFDEIAAQELRVPSDSSGLDPPITAQASRIVDLVYLVNLSFLPPANKNPFKDYRTVG